MSSLYGIIDLMDMSLSKPMEMGFPERQEILVYSCPWGYKELGTTE